MWSSRVNNAPYLDMRKEETESSRSCSIVALLLGSAVLWRIKICLQKKAILWFQGLVHKQTNLYCT